MTEGSQKKSEIINNMKNDFFGHSFMSQNPELYKKMYPEDFGMSFEEEQEQIEWIIPESEEEALALFNDAFGEMFKPKEDSRRSMPLLIEE